MEDQKKGQKLVDEQRKKNKKIVVAIAIILPIVVVFIILFIILPAVRDDEGSAVNTNTETLINVGPRIPNNTNGDPSLSVVPGIIQDDGKYDYNRFVLLNGDMPDGMILQSESGTLLDGGSFDDGYVRFYQRMSYPKGTSKVVETPLELTMQALISEDDTMLDKFQEEIDTGSSRIHSPLDNYETDQNYIVAPAAWVRTDHAIFFLISDRMVDWQSCEGTDDCETLASTGRSLNEDELNIMKKYKILFEMYTGQTQEEWTWSYVGYGNY